MYNAMKDAYEASVAISDAVRTSLGPKGMDKMVRLFHNTNDLHIS